MAEKSSDIKRGFTEIVVVRHGLTEANAEGVLQGHHDSSLSPEGISQAKNLAKRIEHEHFDAIYCSDLSRAKHTAQIIAGGKGVIHPAGGLREWHLGEMENISYDEAREKFPEVMEAFKYDADDITIPSGESKQEFYNRISAFVDDIADKHPGEKILLITHGGVLQAILKHVLGCHNNWKFLPRSSNTSYNKFVRRDGVWQLCCWNDTSHVTSETSEL